MANPNQDTTSCWAALRPLSPTQVNDLVNWLQTPRAKQTLKHWANKWRCFNQWPLADIVNPQQSPITDTRQAALLAIAQNPDHPQQDRAAQILLVQLRPGLIRLVRHLKATRGYQSRDAWTWEHEVQSRFFETLYSHSLQRRPRWIAANLLLDTRQRINRHEARLYYSDNFDDTVAGFDQKQETDQDHSLDALAIKSILSTIDSKRLAEMAYLSWFLEQPHSSVAQQLNTTPKAVTMNLHRLRNQLKTKLQNQAA